MGNIQSLLPSRTAPNIVQGLQDCRNVGRRGQTVPLVGSHPSSDRRQPCRFQRVRHVWQPLVHVTAPGRLVAPAILVEGILVERPRLTPTLIEPVRDTFDRARLEHHLLVASVVGAESLPREVGAPYPRDTTSGMVEQINLCVEQARFTNDAQTADLVEATEGSGRRDPMLQSDQRTQADPSRCQRFKSRPFGSPSRRKVHSLG